MQSGNIRINSIIGQWHIWGDVSNFESSTDWTAKEWGEAFVAQSIEKLTELINETDQMVDVFLAFEKNSMKQ